MYLCHKCAGLLLNEESEDVAGLRGCGCISGYYRGFEKNLTREQGIEQQVVTIKERIKLYERQGRAGQLLAYEQEWLKKIEELRKED